MAGDAFAKLIAAKGLEVPKVLRAFHQRGGGHYSGCAQVQSGNGLARLLTRILGFPLAGTEVPFSIEINPVDGGEAHIWNRHFGPSTTRSSLRYDAQRGCVVESFGPVLIDLDLEVEDAMLRVQVLRARLFGMVLPGFLTPMSAAREFVTPEGRFGFDIAGHLPGVGLLIRYCGEFDL